MAKKPPQTGPLSANEQLYNRAVRHATYVDRVRAGEAAAFSLFLRRKVFPDLQKKMQALASGLEGLDRREKYRRLQLLEDELRLFVASSNRPNRERFQQMLGELASTEAAFQTTTMTAVTSGLQIQFHRPADVLLRQLVTDAPIRGHPLQKWLSTLDDRIATQVATQVRTGVVEGEGAQVIARRVRRVAQATKTEAQAVVRTAVTNVTALAREETYRENRDIVKGVQYVATLDARTTVICADLDGRVFPVDSGPRPPQHINCRSTTIPVLKSWQELGIPAKEVTGSTRASMNGQVSASTTFPKWLKTQSREVQDDVLGKRRAELWRSGKVSFDKFTDGGRVLTLAELRAKEGLTLKDIGLGR